MMYSLQYRLAVMFAAYKPVHLLLYSRAPQAFYKMTNRAFTVISRFRLHSSCFPLWRGKKRSLRLTNHH